MVRTFFILFPLSFIHFPVYPPPQPLPCFFPLLSLAPQVMLATILSGALVGIDGLLVEVEVDTAFGLPQFTTVGLPEGAVRESKDRVRSAIKNSGYDFPTRRITVNL